MVRGTWHARVCFKAKRGREVLYSGLPVVKTTAAVTLTVAPGGGGGEGVGIDSSWEHVRGNR